MGPGGGTKSPSLAAIFGQHVSGKSGNLILACQLARPKKNALGWGAPEASCAKVGACHKGLHCDFNSITVEWVINEFTSPYGKKL